MLDGDDAQYFKIDYHNNYKLVTDQRNQQTYALVQCGTPNPTNLPNGTEIYQVPVTNAAVLETTVVPYLEVGLSYLAAHIFAYLVLTMWHETLYHRCLV